MSGELTVREEIDTILGNLLDDFKKQNWPKGYFYGDVTSDLLALIERIGEQIIGSDATLTDIYGNDSRNNYGYHETQVRDAAGWLQRTQRSRLKALLKGDR